MNLRKYLNRTSQADQLIRLKATGTPQEFAQKLNISERSLYRLLDELKYELECPIEYCHLQQSYYYTCEGRIRLGFAS